jgi:hypothetical protein
MQTELAFVSRIECTGIFSDEIATASVGVYPQRCYSKRFVSIILAEINELGSAAGQVRILQATLGYFRLTHLHSLVRLSRGCTC